jgi:hypothetical protein
MSEQTVEAVLDHIKVALGPLPWEGQEFCETCEFVLAEDEVRYCVFCDIKD